MVLQDRSYQVKIQIPSKGVSEEDRIQITLKRLVQNSEEDEPIGKLKFATIFNIGRFEDSLMGFRDRGLNQVGKLWVQMTTESL